MSLLDVALTAYTQTAAAYVQPSVGSTVVIQLQNAGWVPVGSTVFVATGGYYAVTALGAGQSIVARNLGTVGNASATTVIATNQRTIAVGQPGTSSGGAGMPTVNTISDLVAFDATTTANGSIAKVNTPDDLYEYFSSPSTALVTATDGLNIVQPASPTTGRWVRQNIAPGYVAAWYVDASAGADTNTGLSGSPLKSSEELQRRLCPGGQTCVLRQNTIINFAAGSYGELLLDIDWESSVSDAGASLVIACAYTSSAPITLSAVTATNATTDTRGQLTTASGSFTAKKRIRSTSGANVGALTYSTGANAGASNHFIQEWTSFSTLATVAIANGTTCVVDTLTVTIAKLAITSRGPGYVQVDSAILPRGVTVNDAFVPYVTMYLTGCEIGNDCYGNPIYVSCQFTGAIIELQDNFYKAYGCNFQNEVLVYGGAQLALGVGNCVDGGNFATVGGSINFETNIEFENGTSGLNAVENFRGGFCRIVGKMWGASADYAIGYALEGGSNMATAAVADLAIPATIQIQLAGNNYSYSQVPIAIPRDNCSFGLFSDTGAPDTTSLSSPLKNKYYVDPTFTGTPNGSEAAPYTSITAVFAVAPTTGALIVLAPGANTTENLTFPTSGVWEVMCEDANRATITGNVTITSTVQCTYRFTNIIVTGTLSGSATSSSGNLLYLTNSSIGGNLSLTGSGSGFWFGIFSGLASTFFGFGGSCGGTTSVAGQLLANGWDFLGSVSFAGPSELSRCRINNAALTFLSNSGITLNGCVFSTAPTFTGPGSVVMDGFSYAGANGVTLAGSATLTIRNALAQGTPAQGDVLYFDGTNWSRLGAGTSGNVLTTHGASANPTWAASTGAVVTSSAPQDVTKATAAVGTATDAARSDHKHNVSTAAAVAVGAANAEGSATSLARSDHTHQVTDLHFASQAQGDVAYFNGTNWVRLGAGTSGQLLTTQGASANPIWTTLPVTSSGAVAGDMFIWNGTALVPATTIGNGLGYVKTIIINVDDDAGAISELFQVQDVGANVLQVKANPFQVIVTNQLTMHSPSGGSCTIQSEKDLILTTEDDGSGNGFNAIVAGGSAVGGTNGNAWVRGGSGVGGSKGNVIIGVGSVPDFKGMQNGIYIMPATAAPTAAPATGAIGPYVDPADGDVKIWKAGAGSPITIA
jgi:hypothetical protein